MAASELPSSPESLRQVGRLASRDYTGALQELATLRPLVDAFFDKVLVLHEDPGVRANRLGLLASLREAFLRVADLSRLPG